MNLAFSFAKRELQDRMLRLCLLRHMDTAWALPGQKDIERLLNDSGNEDLQIVRKWIKDRALTPGHVFCSPAARTRQTLEGLMPAFEGEPDISFVDDLYTGFVGEYLDCIVNHDAAEPLMIIGHNPTCASLANLLAAEGDSEALSTVSYTYPTGALAIIDFDISNWSELKEGTGTLIDFLMPRPSSRY